MSSATRTVSRDSVRSGSSMPSRLRSTRSADLPHVGGALAQVLVAHGAEALDVLVDDVLERGLRPQAGLRSGDSTLARKPLSSSIMRVRVDDRAVELGQALRRAAPSASPSPARDSADGALESLALAATSSVRSVVDHLEADGGQQQVRPAPAEPGRGRQPLQAPLTPLAARREPRWPRSGSRSRAAASSPRACARGTRCVPSPCCGGRRGGGPARARRLPAPRWRAAGGSPCPRTSAGGASARPARRAACRARESARRGTNGTAPHRSPERTCSADGTWHRSTMTASSFSTTMPVRPSPTVMLTFPTALRSSPVVAQRVRRWMRGSSR